VSALWPAGRRFMPMLVAAALVVIGLWLAIAAGGGGTDANAGYLQFYPGQLCRFAPAKEAGGPGCPVPPPRQPAR
jgi:hypothetical protein